MWYHNNKEIHHIDDMPEGTIGFIYLIENLTNGRKYIGRKNVFSHREVKLNKRELAEITDRRKKKSKTVIKEADWLKYQGSCKELLEDIKNGHKIKKTILKFTFSKIQTTYQEIKLLFQNEVLESDIWYNSNINSMWFKGNIGQ